MENWEKDINKLSESHTDEIIHINIKDVQEYNPNRTPSPLNEKQKQEIASYLLAIHEDALYDENLGKILLSHLQDNDLFKSDIRGTSEKNFIPLLYCCLKDITGEDLFERQPDICSYTFDISWKNTPEDTNEIELSKKFIQTNSDGLNFISRVGNIIPVIGQQNKTIIFKIEEGVTELPSDIRFLSGDMYVVLPKSFINYNRTCFLLDSQVKICFTAVQDVNGEWISPFEIDKSYFEKHKDNFYYVK